MSFGNYAQTIRKLINGEVSDYMLAQKGIFAISPNLGNDKI
jgi:hypothetical protein